MRSVSDPAEVARLRRERVARRAEEAQRVLEADFPIYGLPATWVGVRVLSGVSWRQTVPLTNVELTHVAPPGRFFDSERSTSRLAVVTSIESTRGASEEGREWSRVLAVHLRSALALPPFPAGEGLREEERRAWLREPERALALAGSPTASTASIPVDDVPTDFAVLALAEVWVGAAVLGGYEMTQPEKGSEQVRVLRLQGGRWPPDDVARRGLARVEDLGSYLAGRAALREDVQPG